MFKLIKEHIISKYFWIGFFEGFFVFPLFFDKRVHDKILEMIKKWLYFFNVFVYNRNKRKENDGYDFKKT